MTWRANRSKRAYRRWLLAQMDQKLEELTSILHELRLIEVGAPRTPKMWQSYLHWEPPKLTYSPDPTYQRELEEGRKRAPYDGKD